MKGDTYKHYLSDLVYLIKDNISKQNQTVDFAVGVKQGYSEILELIESQSIAFGIDLKEIGFDDYEKYENKN